MRARIAVIAATVIHAAGWAIALNVEKGCSASALAGARRGNGAIRVTFAAHVGPNAEPGPKPAPKPATGSGSAAAGVKLSIVQPSEPDWQPRLLRPAQDKPRPMANMEPGPRPRPEEAAVSAAAGREPGQTDEKLSAAHAATTGPQDQTGAASSPGPVGAITATGPGGPGAADSTATSPSGGGGSAGVRTVLDGGNPSPCYPPMMVERGIEGRVVVRVRFNNDGSVEHLEFVSKDRHDRFNREVYDVIGRWRAVSVGDDDRARRIVVRFILENGEPAVMVDRE